MSLNAAGFPSYSIVGTPDGGTEAEVSINDNNPDAFGSYWFLDGDVQGWDSPDMRVTMLTKIGNDVDAEGEVPADLHYRGRSLVLKLYAECESEIARENSRLLLAQAANTSACTFTAFEDVEKQCAVVRSGNTNQGKLTMAEHGYPGKAGSSVADAYPDGWGFPNGTTVYILEATVELYAADPFKYGVNETHLFNAFNGQIVLTNPGTYPSMNARFTLTATGEGSGPLTIDTGERTLELLVPAIPPGAPSLDTIPNDLTLLIYQHLIQRTSDNANFYYLRNMQTPWLRIPTGDVTITTSPFQSGQLDYRPAWL